MTSVVRLITESFTTYYGEGWGGESKLYNNTSDYRINFVVTGFAISVSRTLV